MRTALTFVAVLALVGSAGSARAQYWGPYGGYYGNSTWYSSTPYEGARRGEAAWIEAYGRYLEHEARAAQSWEHAKRERMLNRRLVWQGHREKEMTERADQAQRQREARRRNAPSASPSGAARLARHELSATGAIRWPAVLLDERFAAARARLDQLFAARARQPYGSQAPALVRQIDAAARDLVAQMRVGVREIRVRDYTSARGFVRRLAGEARVAQGDDALAMHNVIE